MGRIEDFMMNAKPMEESVDIPDLYKFDDNKCHFIRNGNYVYICRLKESCWVVTNVTQDNKEFDLLKGGFVERDDRLNPRPWYFLDINEYLQFKTVDDAYDYLMDNFPEFRSKDI